jgi:hypothetical protein
MPFRKPSAAPGATFTDIEHGPQQQNDASLSTTGADSSQTVTPESQRSLDYVQQHQTYLAAQWDRIRERIPAPVVHYTGKAVAWIKGPQPPKTYHINPLFENIQRLPIRILARLPKTGRIGILCLAFAIWIVVFGVIISDYSLPTDIARFGAPVRLACTSRLWYCPALPEQ